MFRRYVSIALACSILFCPVFCGAEETSPACLRADVSPSPHHHETDCAGHTCFCSSISAPARSPSHVSIAAIATMHPDWTASAALIAPQANPFAHSRHVDDAASSSDQLDRLVPLQI